MTSNDKKARTTDRRGWLARVAAVSHAFALADMIEGVEADEMGRCYQSLAFLIITSVPIGRTILPSPSFITKEYRLQ